MKRLPVLLMTLWALVTLLWWGLAFAPVSTTPPEWLETLRVVCFGTSSNGLPAPFGWMMLIGVPITLFLFIKVMWYSEMKLLWRQVFQSNVLKAFFTVLILIGVFEALWVGQKIYSALQIPTSPEDFQVSGVLPETYPRLNKAAPGFELLDQFGEKVSVESIKGEKVYLTFAFAHCQTICPMIVQNVQKAFDQTEEFNPKLVVVTLDPWRDTPSSLPTLAKQWELRKNQHVLSGEVENVLQVLKRYNMPIKRDENTGDVSHPGLVYVIDESGQITYALNNPSVDMIAEAGRRSFQ